jgi:hypothetical protein
VGRLGKLWPVSNESRYLDLANGLVPRKSSQKSYHNYGKLYLIAGPITHLNNLRFKKRSESSLEYTLFICAHAGAVICNRFDFMALLHCFRFCIYVYVHFKTSGAILQNMYVKTQDLKMAMLS